MGQDSAAWVVVGGRKRLGRTLAEGLAQTGPLVVSGSATWEGADGWVETSSSPHPVRTLVWDAGDPVLGSRLAADLVGLEADGWTFGHAVLVASLFPEQPLGTWTAEDLAALWQVNLTFPLLVAQALAPHLQEGGSLQILLDTSIHRPWLKRVPYSVAKQGLAALVPALAQLLAPRVRVVGHALGTVLPDAASDPAFLAQRSLLQRTGTPDDVLRAIRYVAESPFLTGEILTLDGGRRWV